VPPNPKTEVRDRLRALRRERVPGRDRARDAAELELASLEVAYAAGLAPGDWVAAYESTPLEPPTEAMVAALVARGIRVMVPVTLADWDLDWREAVAGGGAAEGAAPGVGSADSAGRRDGHASGETLGREAIARAAVVFVPAHGVDRSGTRIGRGKGCYDRALPRTDALVVAVVHPWEVLAEELPREPHDRPVHAVLTADTGVSRFA
jgi:5-formyltetrahydrofolate cyclo-ligase